MNKPKRIYETTFIVNASLDDPMIEAEIEKVKEVIVKHGGEIREETRWGRKRFAYPIKKKNNGFYTVVEFLAPGDVIARLERHYLLNENILRYLTIQLEKKALKAKAAAAHQAAQEEFQSSASASDEKPTDPVASESRPSTAEIKS